MSCIVPRTCTEVRAGGNEVLGVAAGQGPRTTRRRPVGQGDGEPRGAVYPVDRSRDALSRPLADFRTVSAYVLLGDPGSGKSTSFGAECDALGPAGCFVTARDFLTFDPGVHPEWRGKTVFIDGLDEVRIGSSDARGPLDALRRRLDVLGRPPFRLSCREADWLGANDRDSLVKVSPHASLTVLRLNPLGDEDVERILSGHAGVGDASLFIAKAREKGVGGFLENPQCLNMLADVVTNDGGWPGSRLALFEQACLQVLREHNEEHDAAGPATGRAATAAEDLLDAAGRLCAVLLLSGAAGWATARRCEDHDHPHLSRCGREYEEPCGQAIATKLFKAVVESEGRFRPVHRHVAEFLAGRHLARLVDGESWNDKEVRRGIPARRVIALMTGRDGRVVTALRGLSAWMAAQSEKARRDIVERDPIGVGIYGDVSRFSTGQKVALLKSLASESRHLEEVLRASALDASRPMSAAGSLVAPDTEHALREILTDPRRDDEQQVYVLFILRALAHGDRLQGLAQVLPKLIRDDTRWPSIRGRALDALLHHGRRDRSLTTALKELLAGVQAGRISDPHDHLLGTLLMRLYPGDLSPAEVWTYLSESAEPRYLGEYFDFWRRRLLDESSDAALGEHLDLLVARRDDLRAALRSRGLDDLPAQLLVRGLEAYGERLETSRLYDWLGVGPRWDCRRAAGGRIRDWLTRRPAIQKAILGEGMRRCAKSQDGHFGECALDVERRLYGAGCPPDFGLWCLERAEEATDPRVAGYFLDRVRRTLDRGVGDDGLTHEYVIERTRDHPILARRVAERVAEKRALDVECLEIQRGLAQAEREREREHGEWLAYVRAHETALRENRCPPALLHQLAAAYFDRLVDVAGATPADRLEHLLRGDRRLLEAAWKGLHRAVDRNDLPHVEEIVRLRDNDQLHFLALPVLAGAAEMHAAGAGALDRLAGNQVRSALAFHYCTRGVHEAPWYPHVVRSRPEVVADVLVRCASPLLKRSRQDVPGLDEVASLEDHAEVARHAVLPLLRAYPLRAAVKTGRLDGLLWAALRHADAESLRTLIARKSSLESMGAAQRVRWLAAGVFASPKDYIGRLERFAGGHAERARHVAGFFDAGAIAPTRRVDEAHRRSVASSLGERLKAPVLDRLIRLAARTGSPHPGVTELIRGLAVLLDAEAGSALESLACDPAMSAWKEELVRARGDQLAVRRDATYRHPDAEAVRRALDDGPPANAGDLAALVTDRLDEMGARIRTDNANGWRLFWNEDSRRHAVTPKHEDSCRDALLGALWHGLPEGVDAQPEGRYANDKRADIRVSCGDFHVPVEIKKNGHRKLWSALREQLMAGYARDPATDGYGIYMVLWFGEIDRCSTPPPPSGSPPRGPVALRRRLQDTMTREEARKISVCVIDVSAPQAETR